MTKLNEIYKTSFLERVMTTIYHKPKWFIEDFYYDLKMKSQVLTRGYSDRNMWNYYHDMAELNVKILTKFKKEHVGYPSQLTEKQWDKVLDTIIDGFACIVELDDSYDNKVHKKMVAKFNKGMELYTKWYFNLWD